MSLHFPTATVSGPHWQRGCELGPGFQFWTILLPMPVGSVGSFRLEAEARRVCAAYRDPNVTAASLDAAWGR
jgi:hypothetical protein